MKKRKLLFRKYKNEFIIWGYIALLGMLPITFYHLIIR